MMAYIWVLEREIKMDSVNWVQAAVEEQHVSEGWTITKIRITIQEGKLC